MTNGPKNCETGETVELGDQDQTVLSLLYTLCCPPRLFEEKRRDTVFGFPWCVVRKAFRICSTYTVPANPPTVDGRSF